MQCLKVERIWYLDGVAQRPSDDNGLSNALHFELDRRRVRSPRAQIDRNVQRTAQAVNLDETGSRIYFTFTYKTSHDRLDKCFF